MLRVSRFTYCLWVVGLWLLSGCAPRARGVVSPDGFTHTDYHYKLVAEPSGQLMPEKWKIDNYYEKDGTLNVKDTPEYSIEYELDKDGDGEFETTVKELRYDLRFKHLVHDGVVFLRTIPISTDLQDKKLSVLMHRYIEGIAGAGYEVVQFYPGKTIVVEKRYAAAVVDERPVKLAGLDAYLVTLDVANIDQVQVDANARSERVQLILAHTGFKYQHMSSFGEKEVVDAEFPVVLLVGYGNRPDEFDSGIEDFHNFLGRLVINETRGFEQGADSSPAVEMASEELEAGEPEPTSKDADPGSEAGESEPTGKTADPGSEDVGVQEGKPGESAQ